MPISQTTIVGSVKRPDDTNAAITGLEFTLSGSDFEGGEWIVANRVTGTVVTAEGDFSITLWPNDRGIIGDTLYSVRLLFSDGSSVSQAQQMRVQYSPVPRTIEELVFEGRAAQNIAPMALRTLTRAEFDALTERAPNTAYLILRPADYVAPPTEGA